MKFFYRPKWVYSESSIIFWRLWLNLLKNFDFWYSDENSRSEILLKNSKKIQKARGPARAFLVRAGPGSGRAFFGPARSRAGLVSGRGLKARAKKARAVPTRGPTLKLRKRNEKWKKKHIRFSSNLFSWLVYIPKAYIPIGNVPSQKKLLYSTNILII